MESFAGLGVRDRDILLALGGGPKGYRVFGVGIEVANEVIPWIRLPPREIRRG